MDSTCVIFDGVKLVVPVVNGQPLHIPHNGFDDFDTYCGAGQGFGDLIVPDDIYGVVISPACYIHDKMWAYAPPSTFSFNYSNYIFYKNIVAIIEHFQPPFDQEDKCRSSRYSRAALYYTAVQTGLGPTIFWHMKKEQDQTWEYA